MEEAPKDNTEGTGESEEEVMDEDHEDDESAPESQGDDGSK